MPDFSYTALASTGAKSTGTVTAGSEREAAALLDAKGLFPITIAPAGANGGGFSLLSGVSGRELATLYGQLADLLGAGVPLLRALELLERATTNKRLQSVMRDVRMNVAEGTGLAQALAKHPQVFDELVISMVKAGQEGGFLEDVLARTAAFVEHQEEMKGKVVGALAYPGFLLVAGAAVVLVLVVFFVPKFEKVFEGLRKIGEMPILTEILLWVSWACINRWWLMIPAVVLPVFGFLAWARTEGGRWAMDNIKLRLPVAGSLFRGLALARFTRILGTMLANGIPMLRALGISKDSAGNRVIVKAIEQSAESITAGQRLADPLRRNKHFPTDVVEMIAIAEESNTLEKVLLKVSESLERRTIRTLELLVKLIEPLMLFMMAGVVLVVVLGLLLPIFNMGKTVR
ncbi:MAG: type II secretion system F family protein [Fimbriiglobus sp.]|jgi:general secretion pathway protein F/type IV pilus assembly protein PilC|nr:type II secretion system F family protein [Fimbriiglobus sp.]